MAAGSVLISIHNKLLGIDGQGNAILGTSGRLAEQIQAGNVPLFGGKGIPTNVAITNAKGGTANYCLVTFQVTDIAGTAIAGVFNLDVFLSDAATGAGLTATASSGGVTFTAGNGTTFQIFSAGKAFRVQTNASGIAVMQIIDTAKTLYYPVANFNDRTTVGAQLTTASYD